MLLSKEAILAAAQSRTVDVPVPELGGEIRLRTLTGAERDATFAAVRVADGRTDMRDYRVRLVAACAVDADGRALLTVEEAGQLDDLAAPAMLRLYQAAQRLNGLLPDAVEAAEGN